MLGVWATVFSISYDKYDLEPTCEDLKSYWKYSLANCWSSFVFLNQSPFELNIPFT